MKKIKQEVLRHAGIDVDELGDAQRIEPFRPSNSDQGHDFTERWCAVCKKDSTFRNNGSTCCNILTESLLAGAKQWIYVSHVPLCTSFVHMSQGDRLSAQESRRRSLENAGQMSLLGYVPSEEESACATTKNGRSPPPQEKDEAILNPSLLQWLQGGCDYRLSLMTKVSSFKSLTPEGKRAMTTRLQRERVEAMIRIDAHNAAIARQNNQHATEKSNNE